MGQTVADQLGVERGRGRGLGWWGVVMFSVTEGMVFVLLLFIWFYLRGEAATWPPAGVKDPELMKVSIRSGLLFASSATVAFADHGIRQERRWRLYVGITLTLLLAAVFLVGHVEETLKVLHEYTWRDHAYGSLRYTILNFHAAHLIIGMGMLGFVLFAGMRGRYGADDHLGVQVAGLYWHFVDLVWLSVFTVLYVLPRVT